MERNFLGNLPQNNEPFGRSQREAFELASRQFLASDISIRCELAGANYMGSSLSIPFLGRRIILKWPEMEFVFEEPSEEVPMVVRILTLHYLNTSDGSAPSGQMVSFRNLAGAQLYHPNFEKRVTQRLVGYFGNRIDDLARAAEHLGGHQASMGDVGVILHPFPKIPLTCVMWRGDEEFPASGSALLDSTVLRHLPVEDVVVTAQETVGRLIRAVREG